MKSSGSFMFKIKWIEGLTKAKIKGKLPGGEDWDQLRC